MRQILNTLYVMTPHSLLDGNGRFKARLEGAASGNILLRQAQHRQASDSAFALNVSRAMIAGKLRNARQVLLRGAREAADEADAKTLTSAATALCASVRNLPLAATRPHQCLLSFLYSMLMNDCRSALEAVGLDPQRCARSRERARIETMKSG